MAKLEIFYIGNNEILIRLNVKPKLFTRTIETLFKIPVFLWDKNLSGYRSSIHHIQKIYNICRKYGYKVAVTEKVDMMQELNDNRIKAIQIERNNENFQSELWTKDPDFKTEKYQAKAINVCTRARRFMIGDDVGVGKTIEGLGILCNAFEEGHEVALIVSYTKLKYQWKSEILKFTNFKEEDISIVDPYNFQFKCPLNLTDKFDLRRSGSPCKTCERKDKCKREKSDCNFKWKDQVSRGKILITHHQSIDKIEKYLLKRGVSVLICDEASAYKNHGTKMTKAILRVTKNMPDDSYVIPMSGTFIENSVTEMYTPFTMIDPTILGRWSDFKKTFLVVDHWGNITDSRNNKSLKRLIDTFVIRRTQDEVWIDKPPLIELPKECPMTIKQRDFYDNMVKGTLEQLDDLEKQERINLANIAPLINYLIQCCDTTEVFNPALKESGKIEVLKELIQEISKKEKILMFSFFGNKVIPIIERELKSLDIGGVGVITGKTKNSEEIKQKFINDSKMKFLLCSDAMSYGANLQVARYVINFDLPWNPKKLDQRIARVYRKGQKRKVFAFNLVTPNSIEDKILEKLSHKRKIFDYFLGSAKSASRGSFKVSDLVTALRKA